MASIEEKLINSVRERSVLYDHSHSQYKESNVVLNNWNQVALECDLSVTDAKKKWKNLRDTFVKRKKDHLEKTPSGAAATAEPTWLWYKHMEWLIPYLSRKTTKSNLITTPSSPPSIDDDHSSRCSTPASTSTSTISETPLSNSCQPRPSKRKAKESDFELALAAQLAQLTEAEKNIIPPDECSRFGEEIGEDIRKITEPYQRAMAMREIRDVIFKYRFNSTTCHEPTYTNL